MTGFSRTRRALLKLLTVGLGVLLVVAGLLIGGWLLWIVLRPPPEGFAPTAGEAQSAIGAPANVRQYTIDARSRQEWVYFDFSRGAVVSTSQESLDWDLALRRTDILTNGGETNPDGLGGAVDLNEVPLDEAVVPGGGKSFMPTPCFQCENAPCLHVCPVGATFQNEGGIVLVDQERCIGCRFCMAACPYSRRFFNWGDPELPPAAYFAESSPEYPVPARKGTVSKCMMCAHRLREGKLPHCVEGCPMGAIYLGDLVEDRATNGEEVVTISKFLSENSADRYKEELGTKPRVYYIPGYGQEFQRSPTDQREMKSNPTWQEREAEPPAPEPTPSPVPGPELSSHIHEGS